MPQEPPFWQLEHVMVGDMVGADVVGDVVGAGVCAKAVLIESKLRMKQRLFIVSTRN